MLGEVTHLQRRVGQRRLESRGFPTRSLQEDAGLSTFFFFFFLSEGALKRVISLHHNAVIKYQKYKVFCEVDTQLCFSIDF